MLNPSGNPGRQLHPQSGTWLWASWSMHSRDVGAALAGQAPSAVAAATKAREVKAPGVDGHSLLTQDAANCSGGGGSHSGVLREGAEDGSGQGHHHGRGLDHHPRVLALPDAGLIAAVGQRGRAAGRAGLALVGAGHVCGPEVQLGERAGRKQKTRAHEKQHCGQPQWSQGTSWPSIRCPAQSPGAASTKSQPLSAEDPLSPSLSHEKQLPALG